MRVEGRWAYMPVLTKDAPQDASKPDGARRYEGYAVPLMVAEDAAAAASQYETPHELPPVATDHQEPLGMRKFVSGPIESVLHVRPGEPPVPNRKRPMSNDRGMRLEGGVQRAAAWCRQQPGG